jgi:hypothetical protein
MLNQRLIRRGEVNVVVSTRPAGVLQSGPLRRSKIQPVSGKNVGNATPLAGGTGPIAWAACSSTFRAPQL